MDLPLDFTASLPPAAAEPPPYLLTRPARQTVPLVFASPHSGRLYPEAFVAAARLDPVALRKSEDGFVDELFAAAPGHGAPLLAATFPRVFCDVNREPWELDPGMFDGPLPAWVNTASPRVGAGLGTIARVVATGEAVYRHKLTFAEAEDRIRRFWQPYHAALAALIAETRAEFGYCLLIDCHSMPTHPAQAASPPDFVLGDAHGTACAPRATRMVEESLLQLGYRVRRNDPYAGGYVTRHYGRPREGVHALQVEIARPLYMNEQRIERLPRMQALVDDLARLIGRMAASDWSILR
ncbi:N-formylglutamate amidohydrolase [Siccirubricoccus deserti]|uniref:N-formylglutamate amidohydrolase n=1 Tax=Siccirubricoccus deserti TaxID=2013562 RepID=A0A9X0QXR9_9PROT|nr:N-formylglutamate amidohydrolase [Siccirubricoccus deserti]MBC4015845.1 N-formylglutamate amidohydrolase [Siccirubricoccus deserti]GGC45107.1 N-formylglutamate amidohydrolase [Siccirubricoccus deserti]